MANTAATTDRTVNGTGYALNVTNNAEICSFVITVFGDDGMQYHLMDQGSSKNKALVVKVLQVVATVWPKEGFQITANQAQQITGVV